jgi:hypothetical protein
MSLDTVWLVTERVWSCTRWLLQTSVVKSWFRGCLHSYRPFSRGLYPYSSRAPFIHRCNMSLRVRLHSPSTIYPPLLTLGFSVQGTGISGVIDYTASRERSALAPACLSRCMYSTMQLAILSKSKVPKLGDKTRAQSSTVSLSPVMGCSCWTGEQTWGGMLPYSARHRRRERRERYRRNA